MDQPTMLFDAGIESIEHSMDSHMSKMKEEVMEQLVKDKMRVLELHKKEVEDLKADYEARLNEIQAKHETLKEEHYIATNLLKKSDCVRTKLIEAFATKNKQKRRANQIHRLFMNWVDFWRDAKAQEAITVQWIVPHCNRKHITKLFSSWRTAAQIKRAKTEEEFWKKRTRDITKKLITSYEKNISDLRQEVANANLNMKHQKEDGDVLEEKMKHAFMRGVCALNREAMAVFQREKEYSHDDSDKENIPYPPNAGMGLGKPMYSPIELAEAMASCLHNYRAHGNSEIEGVEIDNDRS